jgi:EmrB/QacA subfamily drug resistance transporter
MALAVILTCQLMVVLDSSIVNVALPDIERGLRFTPTDLSWVINAYTLSFGGLLLLGARAGDLLGRRRIFLAGIALFTVASLAGGFAGSAADLLAARAVQGVGAALAAPSALALLTSRFTDPVERLRALGLYTAVSIGGAALGLLAGGMLTAWVSWRWVFFVNVPIGAVLLPIARVTLDESRRAAGRFDLAGALTSTLGVAGIVYGFVHAAGSGWRDAVTAGSFAAGLALLAAFVLVELRAPAPITPLSLFAHRSRGSAFLARLLLVAAMFGMFFFLTQFLQGILGYSPLRTGLAFLPLTVALLVASQASARGLAARFGPRLTMTAGISLSTAGLVWLSQLSADSGYGSVLGPILLFGIGNGLAFVPLTSAALADVPVEHAGAASGLVNVMQQVGGSLGLAVLVTVYGATRGTGTAAGASQQGLAASRQAFVTGADHAFGVAATLLALTIPVVGLAIRPSRPAR